MGLITAALASASNVLSEQWKDYFYCDALPVDVLAARGRKRTSGSGNTQDNILTNGSVIAVADGQCMLIVEQGKVVDLCAEPGEYVYDMSTEPSFFDGGKFVDNLKELFLTIGKRFEYGGATPKDQRIYYFNTKELVGQKYGTASPVPFRVVDERAGIDIDVSVKCFGEYSLKLVDPVLFYTNVCGNFSDTYPVSMIEGQLKSELLSALQPAFSRFGDEKIRYSSVPAHTAELCNILNDVLSASWRETRGLEIGSIAVSSIKATDEDEAMLKKMQQNAAYANPALAGATLVGAQAQAMVDAANNANGAAMGFVGMNAAQAAGGVNANALFQQANAGQPQQVPAAGAMNTAAGSWTCPTCGTVGTGNFCTNCGTKKPALEWKCPTCGTVGTGNFCTNCGTKKPQ